MPPPAMTPVPSDAGCMYTCVAPCVPFIAKCSVSFFNATLTMFLRACAMALEMGTGTSRALPNPKPTRPAPSPTTVNAVKPNWRPPLTTLAVRLTATSFSRNSSCACDLLSGRAISYSSEFQAGFTRGVGQRLDAAVVHEARAIERDLGDARGLGGLRNRGADGLGRLDVAGALQALGDLLLHGRRRGEHLGARGIEHLRIDVLRR